MPSKLHSVFDIVGPIMIGPSSSHTAGAARLGRIARNIVGGEIASVVFRLHGSFAQTYCGHGTDKALLAGILNLPPWSGKLRKSFELAQEAGISYEYVPTDLGDVHPNTVEMVITTKDGKVNRITGSSIGGGNIVITQINETSLWFSGENPTIITRHKDVPGVVSFITGLLYHAQINIAGMRVYRSQKGVDATMVIELDYDIPVSLLHEMEHYENIYQVTYISTDFSKDVPDKEGN